MEPTAKKVLQTPRQIEGSGEKARFRKIKLVNAVEVTLALTFLGVTLGGTAINNLIMYRTCVHTLNYSTEECVSFLGAGNSNHTQELENEVQEHTSVVITIRSALEGVGPAVLCIFVGGWSDKHGRKPLLVIPLLGMTISVLLTVAYSLMDFLGPWWLVLASVPFTLVGGYNVVLIGMICYITDITTQDTKTFSFVIVQTVVIISSALGGLASSYILDLGMVYLLMVQAGLYAMACAFTKVFIEESMKDTVKGTILNIFDLTNVKEMIRTCFLRKPNYGRAILLLVMLSSSTSVFILYGGVNLIYLYTRAKIQWSMMEYNIYSAITSVLQFAGSMFGIGVVQRVLGISDLNFVAIALVSSIIENLARALATMSWHMYLGSGLALFGSLCVPLVRTFISKTVPGQDIAKVFGLMGCVDAVLPLLAHLLYNSVYAATVSSFPAAIMVMSCGFFSLSLVCVLIAQYLRSKVPPIDHQNIGESHDKV